ncbi:MAG: hypothetical protein RIT04_492 [Candidatus Parcubacteria bacterium]|jgi:phosphohistidine swiveling domain-containing protein
MNLDTPSKTGEVKYKVVRSRKLYPFPGVWNYESETQDATEKLHGKRINTVWTVWKDGMFTAVYDQDEWDTVGMFIAKRMREDAAYLKTIYAQQKKVGEAAIATTREIIGYDFNKKSEKELIELYGKLKSVWIGYDHINTPPWFIGGDYYQVSVLDILKDAYHLSPEEIEKIITPPAPSFSHEEEVLLYKAARTAKEGGDIQSAAKQLSDKFYWTSFGYDGPDQNTPEQYMKKIQALAVKEVSEITAHIEKLESLSKRTAQEHTRIIDMHHITNADLELIRQIYVLAEMTDWRKEVTFQIHVAIWYVLAALAKKYAMPDQNDLRFVSVEELKTLSHKDILMRINERKSGLVHITRNAQTEIVIGSAAEILSKTLIEQTQATNILKGKVGSRGTNSVVVGIVKVLMRPSEMDKVNQGDIVVATMTTPEYVPAMRKASAILTDEGGVTCHAAIVSRELGLPAIIAIGNATKVLKDGDKVEVNTDKGIVTILK